MSNYTRRDFVTTSLAGVAGLSVSSPLNTGPAAQALPAEDGYKLWLRYAPLPTDLAQQYRVKIRALFVEGTTPTARIAGEEVSAALRSMIQGPSANGIYTGGGLAIGTPANSPIIRDLAWKADLAEAGPEGFIIRAALIKKRPGIAIASEGEAGALYGAFHFLRLIQAAQSIDRLNIVERPKVQLRMVNHWDNMDGTIERGYAGRSLWQWNDLPDTLDQRYTDYARAHASVGINGTVINSVNANVLILTPEYLLKVKALADVFRPYGLRTYFCGFLVKANSEGQPGPKDYGRNHAEGANCLADAVASRGGHVIWRAFIYDEDVDPDRAKRAYLEFTRLDGQFKPNVLVQVKNGAIDFMPREPFHPLFGALDKTPVLAEIQATPEYLGQARHLVYLGTMWEEFLGADTYAKGKGSTVAKVLEGAVKPQRVTGIASVLNPGLDRNWCGHHFSQANWYASGRLAWNPELPALQIADEWTRMTFGTDAKTVETIRGMMMTSREAFVNYTMPLGLHHLIGGNHYAPMPQNAKAPRADWTATYYHQASTDGIGFDRTMRGNKAVGQYFPAVRDMFDRLETCPEMFLLWFHRCGWDYKTKSGKTLWVAICEKYHEGARQAAAMQATWQSLADRIDPQRHKEVADRLAVQVEDAAKWRDQILQYFQQFSQREIVKP
jgi:alpha-glucuronidase